MKNYFFVILCISNISVSAQCDKKCQKVPEKVDYCFQDTLLFPGQCAQFIQGQNYFYLNGKKAPFKISFLFPVDTKYLLSLANNKQLKLSTADVLFIQQALQVWKVEEKKLGYTEYESGLGIKILKEGDGALPVPGKIVVVHYTGTLEDGTKFDSSIERGEPFRFPLGQGYVIRGWDEGIAKLKVGTKAMLRIPPHIGYGNRPVGPIPANSTLYFEVELLQIED